MRVTNPGYLSFAIAMMALGLLGFTYGDFALVWQEVPQWVPAREAIAYACATVALAGGLGLLWARASGPATAILFVYLSAWLLLLRAPKLITAPLQEVSWSGCGENAIMVAGAWALFATLNPSQSGCWSRHLTGERGIRAAMLLYGLALSPCGLAHLVYSRATAELVPAWLPWHLGWAYLTGVAFLLAAAAILLRTPYARLATNLSAAMMGAFTLLIWLPAVVAAPRDRFFWTGLCISSALTVSGWAVAEATRQPSWIAWQPDAA